MVKIASSNILKFVKAPLFISMVASAIFISIVYQFLLRSNLDAERTKVESQLDRLKLELPELVYAKNDIQLAKRLAEVLRVDSITGYELYYNDELIESWSKSEYPTAFCKGEINRFLTNSNGLYVGKLKTCLDHRLIAENTLFSPLLVIITMLSLFFMGFVGFLSLASYKSSIMALFEWRKDPNKNLKVNKKDRLAQEIATSIREFHKNELELEKTKIDFQVEKDVFEMTKQVGHDISSPANTLKFLLDNVSFKSGDESKDAIKSSINRILEVSSDLKNKKGSYGINLPKIQPISGLVAEIVNEKKLTNPSVSFDLSLGDTIEAYCNHAVLKRVLSNVLNNSLEAMNKDRPKIEIRVLNASSICKIVITDNGKGISQEAQPHVFDYEFTDGKKGTGLGLSYAKHKLESWGGEINILNSSSDGTKIEIILLNEIKKRDESPYV